MPMFHSCSDPATTAVGGVTFGSLLKGVFNRANQLIQQAQTSGLMLEVNGGAQVQNLIISARDAFKDDLNVAANAMSSQQQQIISGLDATLNKVQAGISDVTADITQIALILPLTNKFPQLTKYKGTIVSPNQGSVMVELSGVFLDVSRKDYDAIIKMDGKTFKPLAKTTQQIRFSIPKSEFKVSTGGIEYKPFDIDVNYKKSGFLSSSKKVATFKLYFVQLPETFGTIH